MLESRSRLDVGEKKTCAVTVKMPEAYLRFCDARARQNGMESAPEYIRRLIEQDKDSAEHEFNLLATALGVKDSSETMDSGDFAGGQS